MAVPSDNSPPNSFSNLSHHTGEGVIIDIGTGDGHFVYQSARENPNKFYIGIDANVRPLEKISEKIHRKPAKGGAPNVLFIQATVEDLPAELNGVASEVHVHFPWGSLLKAVAIGESDVLSRIRNICEDNALFEIVFGLDPERDARELKRLQISPLTFDFIDQVLTIRYREAGFELLERGIVAANEWPEFKSTWAKRLKGAVNRPLTYLIFQAT